MSPVKLLTIFVENKPGETARITKLLAEAGANIRWITVASASDDKFGVMKLLLDKSEPALQILKQKGLTVSQFEVLAVEVKDRPGALHAVADSLARHSVNVQNVSGFVAGNRAVMLLEVQDVAKAHLVLEKQGLRLLSQEEMLKL